MGNRLIRSALILFLFSVSSPVMAQQYIDEDEASLFAKIFCLFQHKEPEWELENHALSPNGFTIRLVSRKGRAYVSTEIFRSEAEALGALKSRIELRRRAPSDEAVYPPPQRYTINELKEFGQESYLLTSNTYWGTFILFRKGHYLVDIMGQPEGSAKRFARRVADFLPQSNDSFNPTPR